MNTTEPYCVTQCAMTCGEEIAKLRCGSGKSAVDWAAIVATFIGAVGGPEGVYKYGLSICKCTLAVLKKFGRFREKHPGKKMSKDAAAEIEEGAASVHQPGQVAPVLMPEVIISQINIAESMGLSHNTEGTEQGRQAQAPTRKDSIVKSGSSRTSHDAHEGRGNEESSHHNRRTLDKKKASSNHDSTSRKKSNSPKRSGKTHSSID